ncbi:MAG: hypothetical protein ACXW3Z_11525, partial [Limisphaerales bacterium]
AADGDVVAAIDCEVRGEIVGAVGEEDGVAMAKVAHGGLELRFSATLMMRVPVIGSGGASPGETAALETFNEKAMNSRVRIMCG